MRMFQDSESLSTNALIDHERFAAQLEGRRRKRRYAYLAWLCVGSHYLYLGRPKTQALFWLSAGGLLLWWLIDFLRLPSLVDRRNRRAVADLLRSWHSSMEQRHRESRTGSDREMAGFVLHTSAPAARFDDPGVQGAQVVQTPQLATNRWNSRQVAGLVLAAAAITTVGMYAIAPPPLHSRAQLEPTFRTLRQVNVRALPSTASPVRAVVRKNMVLKGQVEELGGRKWLWITRGANADGYVAVRNLEKE